MALDEVLKLESLPAFRGDESGSNPLQPTKPSKSGLSWVAVPGKCSFFYRIDSGNQLQAVKPRDDDLELMFSKEIPASVVALAASDDGRLVCLACSDGSLRCMNAVEGQFSERWTLPNAHSHVSSDPNEPAGGASRDYAASASGPVRSLQFRPGAHDLLMVDAAKQTVTILQANSSNAPKVDIVDPSNKATCAAWGNSNSLLALGRADGLVDICTYETIGSLAKMNQINLPDDADEDPWTCTHLEWLRDDVLGAGYCSVLPPEDDEEDSDDEDDPAEHKAMFTIFELTSTYEPKEQTHLEDVVAFFSVPMSGRHVFYSTKVSTRGENPLLLVATNVSSDVAVIANEDGAFKIIDIPEGDNAAAPTDEDDEFTFPIGIDVLRTSSGPRLLLNSTDGSLVSWKILHSVDSSFFPDLEQFATVLPTQPLEAAPSAGEGESTGTDPKPSVDKPNFGSTPAFGSMAGSKPLSSTETASKPLTFGAAAPAPGAFSFGATPASTGPDSSAPLFGSTSALGSNKPAFGVTSPLGTPSGDKPTTSSTAAPLFGSGTSAPVFGSTFGSSGFAALSKTNESNESTSDVKTQENKNSVDAPAPAFGSSFGSGTSAPVFGFSKSASPGFAALGKSASAASAGTEAGTSPFNIFGKTAASPMASMAKPLFGAPTEAAQPSKADKSKPQDAPIKVAAEPAKKPTTGSGFTFQSVPASSSKPAETSTGFSFGSSSGAAPSSSGESSGGSQKSSADKAAPESPEARKAAKAFDGVDKTKSGKLPVSKMEDLLEELGEGFHGEELDKQISLIDTNKSGYLERKSFIEWYQQLSSSAAKSDEEDANSLDSDEEEEWAEQVELVQTIFDEKGTGGGATLEESKFPDLIEGLGTVYCEDKGSAHARAKKKLTKKGLISIDDFLSWYKNYLFGDDESSESDGEEEEDAPPAENDKGPSNTKPSDTASTSAKPPASSWGNTFAVEKGSWKCEICSVRNKPDTDSCASCETPRPGSKPSAKQSEAKNVDTKATSASIGPSGFTFGATSGSTTKPTGGFSFGTAAPASTAPASGFSFGAPAPATKSSTTASVGGFSFGGPSSASTTTSGFSFGSSSGAAPSSSGESSGGSQKCSTDEAAPESPEARKAAKAFDGVDKTKSGKLPVSKMEDLLEELGEGFHGEELDKQISLIDTNKSGYLERKSFIEWYQQLSSSAAKSDEEDANSLDSDEEEEWAEQVELVQTIFDEKGTGGGATLEESKFPDLIEGLGTVYCEDKGSAHARAKKKLTKKGLISIDDFLSWYKNYLFGDDESSESDGEEEEDAPPAENDKGPSSTKPSDTASTSAKPPASSWGNTFAVEKGSWKCEICSVRNKPDTDSCASCETPRPGSKPSAKQSEAKNVDTKATSASIGPSGFTFGATSGSTTKPTGGFSFGTAAPASTAPASGFSFGAPAPATKSSTTASVGGFSFGGPSSASTTTSGFSFGSSSGAAPSSSGQGSGFGFGPAKTSEARANSKQAAAAGPSPFSVAPVTPKDSSTSSAYPPTASKAPQTFGAAATATTEKATSSSGYPPTASKAPQPFGSASGTSKNVASSSGYPPTASKAPKPFGSASGTASKAIAASGYPPTASKAPQTFSAAATTKKTTSSSGYPPTAAKAPQPFGSASGTSVKATASSGYPPVASKAPQTFGAAATVTTKKATSPSGYPPSASTAPQPFGSAAGTLKKVPTSSGYPPTASKAPQLFGSVSGTPKTTAPSSGDHTGKGSQPFGNSSGTTMKATGYPPTSSKAPQPFGAVSGFPSSANKGLTPFSAATKPAVGASSGYPPTAAKAPQAFGAAAATKKTTSSSGYPPTASKAPQTFGAAAATKKTTSSSGYPPTASKAPQTFGAAAATKKTTSSSGYPPTASKAPQTFGAAAATKKTTSSSGYPPTASKAPQTFGAAAATKKTTSSSGYPPTASKAPQTFGAAATTKTATRSSGYPPTASKAPQTFGAAAATKKTTSSSGYPPTSSKAPQTFGAAAGTSVKATSSSGYPPSATNTPSLFGAASRPASTTSKSGPLPDKEGSSMDQISLECSKKYGHLVNEMEKTLRSVRNRLDGADSSKAVMAVMNDLRSVFTVIADTKTLAALVGDRVAKIAKERSDLLAKTAEINQNLDDPNRGIDQDLLETQPLDMESESCQRFLSSQAMKLVDITTMLQSRVQLLEDLSNGDIREISETILDTHQAISDLQVATRKLRSQSLDLDTLRAHVKPKVSQAIVAVPEKGPRNADAIEWADINSSHFKFIEVPQRMKLSLKRTTRPNGAIRETPNLPKTSRTFALSSATLPVPATKSFPAPSPFSPPLQEKTRDLWDQQSSKLDQRKAQQLVFTSPRELKQTSIAAESNKVLSGYGTSVEKVRGITPNQVPTTKASVRVDNVVETRPKLAVPSAPLPAGNKGPPRVSKAFGDGGLAQASQSPSSKRPSPSVVADGMGKADSSKGTTLGDLSGLGNLGISSAKKDKDSRGSSSGLGMSFVPDSQKSQASISQKPSATGETQAKPEQDYAAILTQFYNQHNPTKVNSVAATLKKYKGREREMFAKLAQKYNVPSPLGDSSTQQQLKENKPSPPSIASPFPQSSKSMGLSGTSKPPLAPSPFSTPQNSTSQKTPAAFGSPAPALAGFGSTAPAPSAFGVGPAPSAPGFGATTPGPAQTPFSQAASQAPASSATQAFAGKSPKEMLTAFYQQYNSQKVHEVDGLLAKYSGKEEQLFRKLAQKYKLDPSIFGLTSPPAQPPPTSSPFGQPQGSGFGQVSALGSPSPFGAAPPPASSPFGQPTQGSGFGQTSPLGAPAPAFGTGGFGGAPSSTGFGATQPSSTFGSMAAGTGSAPTFGSMAQTGSAPTFGSMAQSNAAPSSFGSIAQNSPSGFGQPSFQGSSGFGASFGNPRR